MKPVSRKNNIVVQEFEKEILIYDLGKNKAYCLNETSAMVWQECDGQKDVAEISRILSKNLKSNVSEDIVWLALNQFKKDNLINDGKSFVTPFDGLNRREIVKRIGFASIVALPIVASVTAPTAINAQSTTCGCSGSAGTLSRSGGCPCTMNSDCCTNVCGAGGTICTAGPNGGGAAGCCVGVICPPANGTNLPSGCGCLGNPNCASGSCVTNICTV